MGVFTLNFMKSTHSWTLLLHMRFRICTNEVSHTHSGENFPGSAGLTVQQQQQQQQQQQRQQLITPFIFPTEQPME